MDDHTVYEAMAEYQKNAPKGWALQDVAAKLHDWAEILRFHFKLEIPAVPLRIAKLRFNCLGHFNPGFNDFGLLNEIAIDVKHLIARLLSKEWWEVLATLFHEQLHFWQQLHGKPSKPGPGNYHNVQYRKKAGDLGVFVSDRGVNEGYDPDGPFLSLLRERGVELPTILPGPPAKPVGDSTLKAWVCQCDPPVRLRVGRSEVRVKCLECNAQFFRLGQPVADLQRPDLEADILSY